MQRITSRQKGVQKDSDTRSNSVSQQNGNEDHICETSTVTIRDKDIFGTWEMYAYNVVVSVTR